MLGVPGHSGNGPRKNKVNDGPRRWRRRSAAARLGASRKQDVIMAAQPTPEAPRQSRLVRIQYAAITAMKNDMRSAMPAMVAIMVE